MNTDNTPEISHDTRNDGSPVKKFAFAKWLILLLLLHLVCGSLFLNSVRLGTHELLAAERSREMMVFGNWVIPHLNGKPNLYKPPLTFWQTALIAKFFNGGHVDEFAARLPMVLSAVGLTLLTVLLTRRLTQNPKTALLAGFMFCVSTSGLVWGRRAEVDLQLAAWTALCIAAFWQSFNADKKSAALKWAILSWFALVMAAMTKGPLPAIQIIIVAATMYIACRKRPGSVAAIAAVTGIAIFAAVGVPWLMAVYKNYPTVFEVWREQTVGRMASDNGELEAGHPKPLWFYLLRFWGLILPWAVPLAIGLWQGFKGRLAIDKKTWIFLLGWGVGSLLFLSLISGKRVRYALVCVTPFFIIAALGMQWAWENRENFAKSFKYTALAHAIIAPAAIIGAIVISVMYPHLWAAMIITGLTVAVSVTVAYKKFITGKALPAAIAIGLMVLVALPVTNVAVAPYFETFSKNTGAVIGRYIADNYIDADNVSFYRSMNFGVIFYAESPIRTHNKPHQLASWLKDHPDSYLITKDTRGTDEIETLASIEQQDIFSEGAIRPKRSRYKLWKITQTNTAAIEKLLADKDTKVENE